MRQAQTALAVGITDRPSLHFTQPQTYQHEPAHQNRNMVAGSSLRRHPQTLRSGNTRPDVDEPRALRAKRIRAASLYDREKEHKRRKVADILPPPLRIPLRGRAQPPVLHPDSGPGAVTPPESLNSPTTQPQYDQIRSIEEQARASIRDASSQAKSLDERRKLRSEHGGSRSKTELAQYFPSFEEMLSLDDPDPGNARSTLTSTAF